MPWCPNCRYEYVEGLETCPECGVAMVEALEPLPAKSTLLDSINPAPEKPVALLYTADNQQRADELAALLLSSGFPVLTRSVSPDYFVKYYTGRSTGAVGLYVSEQQLDAARELLGLDESPVPFLYRPAERVEPPDWEESEPPKE